MHQYVSLIMAKNMHNVIGDYNNDIPWLKKPHYDVKADMAFFREMTLGSAVVMGGNTFRSFVKPLPNRLNIVVSQSLKSDLENNVLVCSGINQLVNTLSDIDTDIFVIGGASLAQQMLERELIDFAFISNINSDNTSSGIKLDTDLIGNQLQFLQTKYYHGENGALSIDVYGEAGVNLPSSLSCKLKRLSQRLPLVKVDRNHGNYS